MHAAFAVTAFAQLVPIRLWLVTVLTVLSVNAGLIPTTAQSAILLSPAWLQLHTFPEGLAHSRTNPTPQLRLSSANSGRASSHGDTVQAAAPSSHAPSEARSLAKEGERAQRSVAERARGGGTSTPLAKIEGRKRYGIVSDHLGSPTLLATEAGRVAWQAQLDIYGIPREEGGAVRPEDKTDNPWRFPGQYEDAETGLYYNRFRYYDPELGRYLSEDPIGLLGGEALFGYVHEPLGWWDPLGLACGPAAKLDGHGRWRDANGKFARTPQVSKLAPLKGKRVPAVEKTLRNNGFTRTNPANPKNQRWVHPDRSEVQIHAYGNQKATQHKSGNNAHAHKSLGKHGEMTSVELADSGWTQVPKASDAAHIGLRNPADYPAVSGRAHGQ